MESSTPDPSKELIKLVQNTARGQKVTDTLDTSAMLLGEALGALFDWTWGTHVGIPPFVGTAFGSTVAVGCVQVVKEWLNKRQQHKRATQIEDEHTSKDREKKATNFCELLKKKQHPLFERCEALTEMLSAGIISDEAFYKQIDELRKEYVAQQQAPAG